MLNPVFSRNFPSKQIKFPKKMTAFPSGVFQRSEYTICGAPSQLRRKDRAHFGLCNYCRFFSSLLIFSTRFCFDEATDLWDPTAASSISSPSILFFLIPLSVLFRVPFDQTSQLSLLSSKQQVLPEIVNISKISLSSVSSRKYLHQGTNSAG